MAIFSEESTKKAIDDLSELPKEQGGFGVVAKNKDIGIQGSVSTDIGNPGGWSVAATASWMRKQGASAALWFDWRKKK